MDCGTLDMQRSDSADLRHDVVLRGIFIHPDHISAGFCADEASYSSSSESASTISYEDEGSASELSEAALESLALGGDAQDATQDYFAPRAARNAAPMSSSTSPMTSDSTMSSAWCPSPTSTAATTPTNLSASLSKAMPLARRPSQMANFGMVSPGLPATFPFAAFGALDSDSGTPRAALPRAPSPSRCHPYTRVKSSGTAMQRSVSTPVETQRQVEERERRLSAAEDAMDTRAVKMARSKSGASTPSGTRTPAEPCFTATATASAPMTRRSSGALVSPLSEVFGPDWGKTLPPAPPLDASKPLTFPYNVARPPLSPLRNARSRSFAGLEQAYEPMSLDATPEVAFSSASMASGPRALRPRSRLSVSFGPLTPILPDSNVAARVDESNADLLSSPVRNRLYRGMSF